MMHHKIHLMPLHTWKTFWLRSVPVCIYCDMYCADMHENKKINCMVCDGDANIGGIGQRMHDILG